MNLDSPSTLPGFAPPALQLNGTPSYGGVGLATPATDQQMWLDMAAETPCGNGLVPNMAAMPTVASPGAGCAAMTRIMGEPAVFAAGGHRHHHNGDATASPSKQLLHPAAPFTNGSFALPTGLQPRCGSAAVSRDDLAAAAAAADMAGGGAEPKLLGKGAFGSVYAISSMVAQKRVPLSFTNADAAVASELAVAKRILSLGSRAPPTVLQIYGVHVGETAAAIDMELLDAGDLRKYAGPAARDDDDAVVAGVAKQLLLGLQALHNRVHILHRDIKCQNVLVSSTGAVKLVDFGSAAVVEDDIAVELEAQDQQGSTIQMSPERLRGEVHGAASDVWSVGVTLAEFATGHHPFVGAAVTTTTTEGGGSASADRFWAMAAAIRHTGTDEECEEATNAAVERATASCGPELRSFLKAALRADVKDRATVSQLLQHRFIVDMAPKATTADGGVAGPWMRSS